MSYWSCKHDITQRYSKLTSLMRIFDNQMCLLTQNSITHYITCGIT